MSEFGEIMIQLLAEVATEVVSRLLCYVVVRFIDRHTVPRRDVQESRQPIPQPDNNREDIWWLWL